MIIIKILLYLLKRRFSIVYSCLLCWLVDGRCVSLFLGPLVCFIDVYGCFCASTTVFYYCSFMVLSEVWEDSNYVSSWFSFGRLYVSRNLSISSWLYIFFWHLAVVNIFLWYFVFLWFWLLFLLLHFLFYLFGSSLFFFLVSLARGLFLFIFSENQILVLLTF